MKRNIVFWVEIEGVAKVERTICNEAEAVQAIGDLKAGFKMLKERGYESASGVPGGYSYGISSEGIGLKGEAVAECEHDCIDAVKSLTTELFSKMSYLGLIDINQYPLISAGYADWIVYKNAKSEDRTCSQHLVVAGSA